jgi:hypothetical protein
MPDAPDEDEGDEYVRRLRMLCADVEELRRAAAKLCVELEARIQALNEATRPAATSSHVTRPRAGSKPGKPRRKLP